MTKIINKKTKVVKEPKSEIEVSMYLGTGEWELVKSEKKETKIPNFKTTNDKEEK